MSYMAANDTIQKDGLITIAGAGGFIGGALARWFWDKGFRRIRAVDKKPLQDWYQRIPGVECLCLDLSIEQNCHRACENAVEVYNLVAKAEQMGGIALKRHDDLRAPRGVAGRNSDNTFIQEVLHWEPNTTMDKGLAETYRWIETQYDARKKGRKVVE